MIILKSEDVKQDKFQKHIAKLDEIAKNFGYTVEYRNGIIMVRQIEYDFYNTAITVFHEWNDNCDDVYHRFAVEFSGFGSQDNADREEKIYNSLCMAKSCTNCLNEYLKIMEKDYGKQN